jgi:hypothetical protein
VLYIQKIKNRLSFSNFIFKVNYSIARSAGNVQPWPACAFLPVIPAADTSRRHQPVTPTGDTGRPAGTLFDPVIESTKQGEMTPCLVF